VTKTFFYGRIIIIKTVPLKYINGDKNNVTDECLRHIAPLSIGEPELTYHNGIPKFFSL